MPCYFNIPQQDHREKMDAEWGAEHDRCFIHPEDRVCAVARPVGAREIRNEPEAQDALDKEWARLRKNETWLEKQVEEWAIVAARAQREQKKAHVLRLAALCVGEQGGFASTGRIANGVVRLGGQCADVGRGDLPGRFPFARGRTTQLRSSGFANA